MTRQKRYIIGIALSILKFKRSPLAGNVTNLIFGVISAATVRCRLDD